MPTVTFTAGERSIQQAILVDSGADVSLMDSCLVERLGVCTFPLPTTIETTALDGHQLWKNQSPEQAEKLDLSGVMECYHDLGAVFSKKKATSLPPHRPHDCAINLCPGTSPPKGRLFSLSSPERLAMKEYIDNALVAGLIRPSSSPAGAGFFFVDKKDSSLCSCIDYRGLNGITVRDSYPVPLLSSAFELLANAKHFTKLDLCIAYHLVRIREGEKWKTAFSTTTAPYLWF